ncbi:hypothetical protein PoB_006959300 [Plakobranchus ocellatus]|uniref:Uncharacterized protein n=1 Tax=Plakobranchus ocellatus TaxID=259542 RepID=A0AAV4DG98_9GAST|nr:hypothetical protein PoB_006959300 [Plakobranchus ocellatus]
MDGARFPTLNMIMASDGLGAFRFFYLLNPLMDTPACSSCEDRCTLRARQAAKMLCFQRGWFSLQLQSEESFEGQQYHLCSESPSKSVDGIHEIDGVVLAVYPHQIQAIEPLRSHRRQQIRLEGSQSAQGPFTLCFCDGQGQHEAQQFLQVLEGGLFTDRQAEGKGERGMVDGLRQ